MPINLTGVAYVSQRLESLSNLFVFLGLFLYLRARRQLYMGNGGAAMLPIGMIVCVVLGFSAKESAVLLPLYTVCIELAITGFRNRDGKRSLAALWTHAVLLVLPLIAGLVWLSAWAFSGVASFREFSIGERLLSESRILIDYIYWTLLPNLNALTFYHDDLAVSRGLLDPPTTLLSILSLVGLLFVAAWQRRPRPLFCLGILWFFSGHALTATIIPLELVFEHRNYFPSVGLLLAMVSLLALQPGLKLPSVQALVASGFIAFFAFTTFLRAVEWSHPMRLAYSEALKRPNSPRAQYELARTLLLTAGNNENSPLIDESSTILRRSAFLPNSGIAPLQALIFLNRQAPGKIDPAWWHEIIRKLQNRAPSQTDIEAVIFLFRCQKRGDCPMQKQEMLETFAAALAKSDGNVNLMGAYAEFAFDELGDIELAERMSRDVIAAKPQVPIYRANLAHVLIASRKFDAAANEIAALQALNHLESLDPMIAKLNEELSVAKEAAVQSP